MDGTLAGPLFRLIAALLIGFLIGLDRERAEARKQRPLFAGVRTFPLIALAGALSMLLLDAVGPWLVIACFLAVAGVALISYVRTSKAGNVGATTEVASIATFLLGVLAGTGELALAAAAGVAVAVLLAAKPRLERFSRTLTSEEISAALELAVISVIVPPLLPDRGYGPGEVLNPRDIWLVVVLVCALSSAGFVATRLLGQKRGLLIYGIAGGLVSSTAVTLAMAQRAKAAPQMSGHAAASTVLASGMMALRMLFFAVAINRGMLPWLAPPLLVMVLAAAILAPLLQRGGAPTPAADSAPISNPFSLKAALTFAAIYTLILVVLQAAEQQFGAAGTYAAASAGALADVDAVTIALARAGPLAAGGWREPAAAVTLAAVVNMAVKAVIALVSGRGRFRALAAGSLAAMGAAGAAAGLAVYLRGY
ncbi:MAG TPA: DUF4010 domain-containing protein [Candidatus Polarisedimenticolia bacterium]|nr:DUF4010 domain-containing protein [Candidatus Polarisedimenticolia bacterium]